MLKTKLFITSVLTMAIIATLVILPACASTETTTSAAETTEAETTTTVETTAAETTTTMPEGGYPYYEKMRQAAKEGKEYPDAPAKDFS